MSFFQGKRVVVTGAGGFVGSHLVESLLEQGATVTGTLSKGRSAKNFLKERARLRLIRVDLRHAAEVESVFKGAELVFHLAAVVGGIEFNIAHPASIFRENMAMTFPVLEAARHVGLEKICLVSSACVYPRFCSLPTPEEEGFKDRPEPTNEGYGFSKRMLEFAGEAYAKEYGLKVCIARPYNFYGPRDNFDPKHSHVIPALIRKAFAGGNVLKVWGDGKQTRSFLFVRDGVEGMLAVMEKSQTTQAYNLGSSEEVQIGDIAERVVRLSERKMRVEFDAAQPTGQPRRQCDTTKAKHDLGFEARTPLDEGLRETIHWYRDHRDA